MKLISRLINLGALTSADVITLSRFAHFSWNARHIIRGRRVLYREKDFVFRSFEGSAFCLNHFPGESADLSRTTA